MIPVFDGHNDTLLNLIEPDRGQGRSFFEESEIGHIDLPRAGKGGLVGGFFAMFTPTPDGIKKPPKNASKVDAEAFLKMAQKRVEHDYALAKTMAMTRLMYQREAESAGKAKVVKDVQSLKQCIDAGTLAMIFHIEGAEAIDANLNALYVLYEAGLRSLGIVWSRPNVFGHGVPFSFPGSPDTGPGLTQEGIELVKVCNELGIMIDVSHLNEKGFWDVVKLSKHPIVATHSCAHSLSASPRNLTDKQMDAIKDSDGMMGINFHVGFLREDGERNSDTPLSDMIRHIEYAVNRIGVDRVGLGSDFDGATMPDELGDATGLPKIFALLEEKGYGVEEMEKLGFQNWIRVLSLTW